MLKYYLFKEAFTNLQTHRKCFSLLRPQPINTCIITLRRSALHYRDDACVPLSHLSLHSLLIPLKSVFPVNPSAEMIIANVSNYPLIAKSNSH